jgi:hypothetical protein
LSCGFVVNGSGDQLIGVVTTQAEPDASATTCKAKAARVIPWSCSSGSGFAAMTESSGGSSSWCWPDYPTSGATIQAVAICRTP